MTDDEVGFVCECGHEVETVYERITIRGGTGKYRCTECGRAGHWVCDPQSASNSGLSGCLVRRDERDERD
jgi:uncharacterized Zn finger protein